MLEYAEVLMELIISVEFQPLVQHIKVRKFTNILVVVTRFHKNQVVIELGCFLRRFVHLPRWDWLLRARMDDLRELDHSRWDLGTEFSELCSSLQFGLK